MLTFIMRASRFYSVTCFGGFVLGAQQRRRQEEGHVFEASLNKRHGL